MKLHFNISKYDPENGSCESNDVYLDCQENKGNGYVEVWDFRSFQTVDAMKKGVLVVQVKAPNQKNSHFKFILVDLVKKR